MEDIGLPSYFLHSSGLCTGQTALALKAEVRMKMHFEKRSTPPSDALELSVIATNLVDWHRKHAKAYSSVPLPYIDALIDALVAANEGNTVREAITELLEVIPGMTENQAFSVALTKFPGINLDSTIP